MSVTLPALSPPRVSPHRRALDHLLWSGESDASQEAMTPLRALASVAALGLLVGGCRGDDRPAPPLDAELLHARLMPRNGPPTFDADALPWVRYPAAATGALTLELTIGEQTISLGAETLERGPFRIARARLEAPVQPGAGTLTVQVGARRATFSVAWDVPPAERPAVKALDRSDREALAAQVAALTGVDALWGLVELARAHHRANDLPEAARVWSEIADRAERAGYAKLEARGARVAAFMLYWSGAYRQAEAALARTAGVETPCDQHSADYYAGMIDYALNRFERGARRLARSVDEAWACADDRTFASAMELYAMVLAEQGRMQAASEALSDPRLIEWTAAEGRARSRQVSAEMNRGWVQLLIAQSATGAAQAEALAKAMAHLRVASPEGTAPAVLANRRVNLAMAQTLAGELDAAEATMAQVPAGAGGPAGEIIRGDLHRQRGRLDAARLAFEQARALGLEYGGGIETDYTWRALHGQARVARAQGDMVTARAHFDEALAALEKVAVRAGVWHARARFFADRRPLIDETADVLLGEGDIAGALAVIDAAGARALRAVEARSRLDRLPAPQREAFEGHRSRFAELRAAYEAGKDEGELLDGAALAAWTRRRANERAEMVAAFEAADALLNAHAPARTPTATDAAAIAGRLRPGQALVAFGHIGPAIHAFWLSPGRPVTHAVVDPSDLLAPFAERLGALDHLYVVPGDVAPARELALRPAGPIGGEAGDVPLGTRLSLSDLPYASALLRAPAKPQAPALVVADPTIDLPHAHTEGKAVADRIVGARLLARNAATRAAVRAAMAGARAMHFAGHGVARAETAWQAHLSLAGGTTLTVADILTAPGPAGTVVLSGCKTGVRNALSAREALGLADAFVMAGARAVLATRRNIPDDAAARFIDRFHAEGGLERPGPALVATADAFHRSGDPIWSAFRLTGDP